MFEISELKAKTLADLQVIAKSIGLSKTSQLKKLDLVYQILDTQASSPKEIVASVGSNNDNHKNSKPKRKRVSIVPERKPRQLESKKLRKLFPRPKRLKGLKQLYLKRLKKKKN